VVGEGHLEEGVAGAALVSGPCEEGARLAVVLERLPVGIDRPRGVAGFEEVLDRLLRIVGLAEMAGEEGVGLLGRFLVDLLERLSNFLVQLAPCLLTHLTLPTT
jgi:hypothetical protein